MWSSPLLFVVLFLFLPCLSSADTFYVTSEYPCAPGDDPCRTLPEYADSPPEGDNITMLFLEGVHQLPRNFSLSSVSWISLASNQVQVATINCSWDGRFVFGVIQHVLFSNIAMLGCYGNDISDVSNLTVEGCVMEGLVPHERTSFQLARVQEAIFLNSMFSQNILLTSSSTIGSALYILSSNVKISNSTFDQNYADSESPYVITSTIVIALSTNITVDQNSSFTNNTAKHGGVFYAEGGNIKASDSTFANNHAKVSGGVAYIGTNTTSDNVFTLIDCVITENSCVLEGGVIHMNTGSAGGKNRVEARGTQFYRNAALQPTLTEHEGTAGVLWLRNSQAVLEKCDFVGNHANVSGAMHAFDQCDVTMTECHFSNHTAFLAELEEKPAPASILSIYDSELDLINCKIEHNGPEMMQNRSTTMYLNSSTLTIQSTTFSNNWAYIGGVVWAEAGSTILATASTFANNYADSQGGMAYIWSNCWLNLDNCTLQENTCNVSGSYGGVISAYNSQVVASNHTSFLHNTAYGAAVLWLSKPESSANFSECNFIGNTAIYGGVMTITHKSSAHVTECHFSENRADALDELSGSGGVMSIEISSTVWIERSMFQQNWAKSGSCFFVRNSELHLMGQNQFKDNYAELYGGVFTVWASQIFINKDIGQCDNESMVRFTNNSADFGGALNVFNSSLAHVECTTFENNGRDECRGGAILGRTDTDIILKDTTFVGNKGSNRGGALFAQFSSLSSSGYLNVLDNGGHSGVIFLASCTAEFSGDIFFSGNNRSFYVHYSDITFGSESNVIFTNQDVQPTYTGLIQDSEGGALTALRSNIDIQGNFTVTNSRAEDGGGLLLTESTLNVGVKCIVNFFNNSAQNDGGAIDAYRSDLYFRYGSIINFVGNEARGKGGAVFVWRSIMTIYSHILTFEENMADNGGAIYFDKASNFYITKISLECEADEWFCHNETEWMHIDFINNYAQDKGGAMYVNDNSATSCSSDMLELMRVRKTADYVHDECFIQALAVYVSASDWNVTERNPNLRNIGFTGNMAANGSVLYGGLLDRCKVDDNAEAKQIWNTTEGLEYFRKLSYTDFSENDIASDGVRLCPCNNTGIFCDTQFSDISMQRGVLFNVWLAIVDHIRSPLTTGTIHARVDSEGSSLGESEQSEQYIYGVCTELSFSVFTTNQTEKLVLYPEGPCGDTEGLSRTEITLTVDDCPPGFTVSDTGVECVCDPRLHDYVSDKCTAKARMVERKGDAWIGKAENSVNSTSNNSDIIAHKFCPYDYCLRSKNVNVSLEHSNGSDSQCAFHRSGRLCGCCADGYTLTLGGSECKRCDSNWWLLLTLVFALAGVLLVALMMIFNLTLASGTISGLLLYANILIANRFVFFPPQEQSFLTVFVSWLGVNLGISTCYYEGMDGFGKIWLQIAFEAYLLILVLVVILLGRSTKVANFFYKYNLYPVHTLATLIMLSFEKLSRKVYSLIAFTDLYSIDGSLFEGKVWLFDPCLNDKPKQVILFIVAGFIILTALVFNFILLFNKPLIAKCHNVYFISFMEAFHAPFKPNHQYWVGLLLLIRNISYIACDFFNAGENPSNSLHFIFTLLMGLLLMKFFYTGVPAPRDILMGIRQFFSRHRENEDEGNTLRKSGIVYKSPYLDLLETSLLVNLLVLTYFTLYLRSEGLVATKQGILFNISSSLVFVTFLGILAYHTCTYTVVARLFHREGREGRIVLASPPLRQRDSDSEEDRVLLHTSGAEYGSKNPTMSEVHI